MADDKEKPVWERIAELGFADAVERKGFKRVNATHWKMEGEGLTWRVRLVRGYKATPTSFLPVHGALVHGLDELYEKWDGSKASEYLHGAGQRVHMQSDTGADVLRATMHQRQHHPGYFDIPYLGQAGRRVREQAFLTYPHDLGQLARFVIELWEAYSWKWIECRLRFKDLYLLHWGPETHPSTSVSPLFFSAAALAEDWRFIREWLVELDSLAKTRIDAANREGVHLGSIKPGDARSADQARLIDNLLQALARVKLARAIVKRLQIDVSPPLFDFTDFDLYVQRNYGSDSPFLKY